MIYDYSCDACGKQFDVVKPMEEAGREEHCPDCWTVARRIFNNLSGFMGEKVTHAEFNPALGCVVQSKAHQAEICKRRGLIEVGNEKPDTVHKEMQNQQEHIRNSRYEEAMKC